MYSEARVFCLCAVSKVSVRKKVDVKLIFARQQAINYLKYPAVEAVFEDVVHVEMTSDAFAIYGCIDKWHGY